MKLPDSLAFPDPSGTSLSQLHAVVGTLDNLGIAACVFDQSDNTLLWNRSFLRYFPEHVDRIHVGEPYRGNLQRFYQSRLGPAELPDIDRYVENGVHRHLTQQRPYLLVHRGVHLQVASKSVPGMGRIRIWQVHQPQLPGPGQPASSAIDASAVLDQMADGVMVTGADDRILWVNEPFVQMYGLPHRAAAIGAPLESAYRTAWQGHSHSDVARFEEGLISLSEHLRFIGAPFELPLPGARWSRVIVQRSPNGQYLFEHVDITVFKRQQQQLREAERVLQDKSTLLEATLERMDQGVLMVNAQRVVEVCNRRALELLDLPKAMMDSRPTLDAVLAYQLETGALANVPADVLTLVRGHEVFERPYCYDRKRPDGRVIEIQSVPVDGGGALRTYTDITERKLVEERIRHVARHDGLTALVNRDAFLEHLASAIEAAGPTPGGFAVLFIDIDRFKPVNDCYGHAIGDKVLALLAERMRRIVRDGDMVARMGGDEFAVLQVRVDHPNCALGLAQRLLAGISQPMEIESHPLQVGASIGIAMYPAAGSGGDTLMRNADAAMYAAKAAGRDCVRLFGAA